MLASPEGRSRNPGVATQVISRRQRNTLPNQIAERTMICPTNLKGIKIPSLDFVTLCQPTKRAQYPPADQPYEARSEAGPVSASGLDILGPWRRSPRFQLAEFGLFASRCVTASPSIVAEPTRATASRSDPWRPGSTLEGPGDTLYRSSGGGRQKWNSPARLHS
jgi:hypothetical protein